MEKSSVTGAMLDGKKEDYIDFMDFCHRNLKMTSQEGGHYVLGTGGCPELGNDLRICGTSDIYSTWKIHKDDAKIMARRYGDHRRSLGL